MEGALLATGGLWFDDFVLGERFALPARSVTPAMRDAYAACGGGDPGRAAWLDPFHLLAQSGAAPFAAALGRSLIRLVAQSGRFVQDAWPGDLLLPVLQVVALEPAPDHGLVVLRSTIHNQADALLLDGEQHYLLRRQAPRGGAMPLESRVLPWCAHPATH